MSLVGIKPDGSMTTELAVTADNELQISVTSGGGGDATAANQTTQITEAQATNTKLDSIDGKLGATLFVAFDGTQPVAASVDTTPSAPLVVAGARGMKQYLTVPVGGINCLTEIAGYPYPTSGFLVNAGTLLDVTQPLGTTTSLAVGPGYWWDDFVISTVLDTSDLQDFYLYWK